MTSMHGQLKRVTIFKSIFPFSYSKKVPDNNLIQRFLHNVLERSFHKGTSTPVTKENKTLTIIKSFSNSQPANSTYGDKFYREIENRTRLRKPLWSLEEKEYVRSSQFIHYMVS